MKTVLFVPGGMENIASRDYDAVLQTFKNSGYGARFISVNWNRTDVNSWTQQVREIYAEYNPASTILAGFSFGAITALLVAAERPPAELWLYSLSPYFPDDNPKAEWLHNIGKRRGLAFSKLDIKNAAAKITCPVKLYYGEQELTETIRRAGTAARLFPQSELHKVSGTGHDVAAACYLQAISKTI